MATRAYKLEINYLNIVTFSSLWSWLLASDDPKTAECEEMSPVIPFHYYLHVNMLQLLLVVLTLHINTLWSKNVHVCIWLWPWVIV